MKFQLVELLFQESLVKVLFATETFAMGKYISLVTSLLLLSCFLLFKLYLTFLLLSRPTVKKRCVHVFVGVNMPAKTVSLRLLEKCIQLIRGTENVWITSDRWFLLEHRSLMASRYNHTLSFKSDLSLASFSIALWAAANTCKWAGVPADEDSTTKVRHKSSNN